VIGDREMRSMRSMRKECEKWGLGKYMDKYLPVLLVPNS